MAAIEKQILFYTKEILQFIVIAADEKKDRTVPSSLKGAAYARNTGHDTRSGIGGSRIVLMLRLALSILYSSLGQQQRFMFIAIRATIRVGK